MMASFTNRFVENRTLSRWRNPRPRCWQSRLLFHPREFFFLFIPCLMSTYRKSFREVYNFRQNNTLGARANKWSSQTQSKLCVDEFMVVSIVPHEIPPYTHITYCFSPYSRSQSLNDKKSLRWWKNDPNIIRDGNRAIFKTLSLVWCAHLNSISFTFNSIHFFYLSHLTPPTLHPLSH